TGPTGVTGATGASANTELVVLATEALHAIDGSDNNIDSLLVWDSTDKETYNRVVGNAATQDLDLYYQIMLPDNFSSWASDAIKITTQVDGGQFDVSVKDTAGVEDKALANDTTTGTITIVGADLGGTWTAGATFLIEFHCEVDDGDIVEIGKIVGYYD
ncbi:hypothetical protein ACFL31_05200, partial [Candidatus Margulisiibacteriota bacterium]